MTAVMSREFPTSYRRDFNPVTIAGGILELKKRIICIRHCYRWRISVKTVAALEHKLPNRSEENTASGSSPGRRRYRTMRFR